jgi:catalase
MQPSRSKKSTAPARRKPARSSGAPDEAVAPTWAQGGDVLTTATGVPVDDTDNSLRVSDRGPTFLDDVHLREKIMHFDHERIPERVVHARGAAAHGTFRLTRSIENLTCAPILCDTSVDTPTFA